MPTESTARACIGIKSDMCGADVCIGMRASERVERETVNNFLILPFSR